MSIGKVGKRRPVARAALVVLAGGGLFVLGVALLGTVTQCYDICDPQSEGWYSRPDAWQRWAQLGAAFAFAVLVLAAARAGLRDRYMAAGLLVLVALPVLTAWLVIFLIDR